MYPSLQPSKPAAALTHSLGLEQLPPFPATANRLLQLLAKEEFEISELTKLVLVDPMLAAELLRMVNSVSYARTQPISSIKHAAALLGHDRLRSFAAAVSLRLYLGRVASVDALARVWRHCLATAACCEILADTEPAARRRPSDTASVAGLLHDVGALGMMVMHSQDYTGLLDRAANEEVDLRSLEVDRFGFDHCYAGEWIARQWKLGPEIEQVALHHHDSAKGRSFATLEIAKAGVRLADALGWSSVRRAASTPEEAVSALPAHFREGLKMNPERLYNSIAERVEMFREVGSGAPQNGWQSESSEGKR